MAGRKNREEGYVLGWVVVMVMILMILVTAILFAASAYYRQSLREYNDRQAYLTARSIVQTAAADFTGNGSGELRDAILVEISGFMGGGSDAELGDEPDEELGEEPEYERSTEQYEESDTEPDDSDVNNVIPISAIKFQLDATMGSCTMTGYYIPEENCLMLTAAAKKGSSTEIMTVYLLNDPESGEEPWTVLGYERGEPQLIN